MNIPDETDVVFSPGVVTLFGDVARAGPLLASHRQSAQSARSSHRSWGLVQNRMVIIATRPNLPSGDLITLVCLDVEWEGLTGEPLDG